jgi:hypothetical protein
MPTKQIPSEKWMRSTLLAILKTLNRHDEKFEQIDRQFSEVDQRFDRLEKTLLTRINESENRILNAIDGIVGKNKMLETEQTSIKIALVRHDSQIEKLNEKVFSKR